SGLLSAKMYGPPVMPPQPDGIWRTVYSDAKWVTAEGEDRYRRAIYTYLRRSSPYPSLVTFDAPSREVCSIRRIRSNTPLQALVTLNDPAYIEAAQALARRMAKESGGSLEQRLSYGMQLTLARNARPDEIKALAALYAKRLATYQANKPAAAAMATKPLGPVPDGYDVAELAALTAVANVLLNLDEFLTKG
ncbi:MAG TPA: DUF1553 domain-containing protein, partial [Hymenobacter sp.]|nr:DUF1553 domain-containing protein [Hymenobacter sp.]